MDRSYDPLDLPGIRSFEIGVYDPPANIEAMTTMMTTSTPTSNPLFSQVHLQKGVLPSELRSDTLPFCQPQTIPLHLSSSPPHFPGLRSNPNDNIALPEGCGHYAAALSIPPGSTNDLLRNLEEDAIRAATDGTHLAKIIEHGQIIQAFTDHFATADLELITPEYTEMAKRAAIIVELAIQLAEVGMFLNPSELLSSITTNALAYHMDLVQPESKRTNSSEHNSQATYKRKGRRTRTPEGCHSCNTRDTPEWRCGPDGARTLCNACGLCYSKLKRKQVKGAHISIEMLRALKSNSARDFTHFTAEMPES